MTAPVGCIATSNFVSSPRHGVRSERFLYQQDFKTKDKMLAEHARRPDSVIVAPAMAEGLDLKGNLGRFQIVLKVPWPSLGDKVVKERTARDDKWFGWSAAIKFTQSLGRVVRSKTDYGYTYVLDSGFDFFMHKHGRMIPQWAKEAFSKYGPKEIRRD